jgi:hypothetical protein
LLSFINFIERTELVSGVRSVTVCIAVRGIERGKMIIDGDRNVIDKGVRPVSRGEY